MATEKKNILNKLYLLSAFMFLFALAIGYKLIDIQFLKGEFYRQKAQEGTIRNFDIPANRGNVYTADGSLLATSVSKFDIFMDPVTVPSDDLEEGIKGLSESLSKMIGVHSPGYYESKIRKARKAGVRYLPIIKNLSYTQNQKIKKFPIFKLGIYRGGLIAEQRTVREHPIGKIAERYIGYDDSRGRVGIEGNFHDILKGKDGKRLKQKIAKNQWKPLNDNNEVEPIDGRDIYTTIDLNIQDVAHHALLGQLEKYSADHGTVVVMETNTGEIKAISNLGRNKEGKYYERLNYAVGESHEPGSTFKLMSMIVALEDKVIDTADVIDTEDGTFKVYDRTVRDSRKGGYGKISAARVFEVSSNVGIVKIIEENYRNNPRKFIEGLEKMGVHQTLNVPIKGEGKPVIPDPSNKKSWYGTSLAWMTHGYGVQITPLQTLAVYNAIANNGEMVRPRFIKEVRKQDKVFEQFDKEVINPKICSQETIDKLKVMMENVVKRGTAENIYDKNYSMAGKTGTCQTDYWIRGGTQYISSFVGYFPATNPKYSCIVVIHKPNKKIGYYGNVVAAPVFKTIAQKIYTDTPIQEEVSQSYLAFADVESSYKKYNALERKNLVIIPNLKHMSGMDAIALLENLGLRVESDGTGVVKSQSIKSGKKIKKGEIIKLIMS